MKFVDEAVIEVKAGDGGRGCMAFLREKYRPHGGPSGGDGGRGGDIVVRADPGLTTLLDFRFQRHLEAGRGEHGRGKEQHGAGGGRARRPRADRHPYHRHRKRRAARRPRPRGRRGGRRARRARRARQHALRDVRPIRRRAAPSPGGPAKRSELRLELRLLADVGLVGYPNAGKSTFIAAVSAARPRIADYPFTTLVPNLGVARVGDESIVLADVPGLIEGAHRATGSARASSVISRARPCSSTSSISADARDPLAAYDAVNHELAAFDPELAAKPQIVVATKLDVTEARERFAAVRAAFAARGIELLGVSAVTGDGMRRCSAASPMRRASRAPAVPPRRRRAAMTWRPRIILATRTIPATHEPTRAQARPRGPRAPRRGEDRERRPRRARTASTAPRIEALVAEIAALRAAGREVVVVTSGAVAAGVARLGLTQRPPHHSRTSRRRPPSGRSASWRRTSARSRRTASRWRRCCSPTTTSPTAAAT